MSPALRRTRSLMWLWLALCLLLALSSIALGLASAGTPGPEPSVEELAVMREDLTLEEVAARAGSFHFTAQGGGAFVASLGYFGSLVLWALGMIPLGALYLVLRWRAPPAEEIQVLPKRPRVSRAPSEEDDEGASNRAA